MNGKGMEKGMEIGKNEGIKEGMEKALKNLICSGINEKEAKKMLGC
ncbi:MAG: hypothetical protein Q9M97_02500 [Candidatus Gracilibacteria bacterium]|nr:hypothetical protein [Candidatus Gracilibacteria bacterium]